MSDKKLTQSKNFAFITGGKDHTQVIKKPGVSLVFLHNFSAKLTVEIMTPDAEVYILGLYLGKKDDVFTLHTIQHHKIGDSVSDLLIKAVLKDNAKLLYEGLIQIDPGAQKSNAYQKNQNVLLSNEAFVDSRPFLEILANDVRCTHGSTTGRLNKEEIFYLMTRGISPEEAEKVLLEGFIAEVFNRAEQLGFKKEVEKLRYTITI